jgi:hypothetical protein
MRLGRRSQEGLNHFLKLRVHLLDQKRILT